MITIHLSNLTSFFERPNYRRRITLTDRYQPHWKQIVRGILNTAAGQIRSQARAAAHVGQLDQDRTLDSIAERTVRTPGGKENSFGLAVTQLPSISLCPILTSLTLTTSIILSDGIPT